jgi:hypothetical protein
MKSRNIYFAKWMAILGVMIGCVVYQGPQAVAGPFNFSFFKKDHPESIIITGNFAKSRLLAELAQMKSKAPILLVSPPAEKGGKDRLFFMSTYPKARQIPADRLLDFLAVVAPEKLIILGDENFVPVKYTKMVKDRYPTVNIAGNSWMQNAKALAEVIKARSLVKEYRKYLGQMLEREMRTAPKPEDIPVEDQLMLP